MRAVALRCMAGATASTGPNPNAAGSNKTAQLDFDQLSAARSEILRHRAEKRKRARRERKREKKSGSASRRAENKGAEPEDEDEGPAAFSRSDPWRYATSINKTSESKWHRCTNKSEAGVLVYRY